MDSGTPVESYQPLQQPADEPGKKKVSAFRRFSRTLMFIIAAGLIFSVYWFYYNKYGNGERTGILVKITHKGNVFKTDEGEMWLSCRQMTNPEKFYFSVTSDSIVQVFKNLQDECVQLSYVQYRAALPWRGDTRYIITGVKPIRRD